MILKKALFLFLSVMFILPVFSTANVQASTQGKIIPPTNELNPLPLLNPVDNIISPQAIVVDIPGPIKYYTFVSNAKLKQIVDANKSYERNLSIAQTLLGVTTMFSTTATTEIAVALSNSPIRRVEQAYYSGENMYIGAYYPTSKPGLSTVPFRYYSKAPLTFRPNY